MPVPTASPEPIAKSVLFINPATRRPTDPSVRDLVEAASRAGIPSACLVHGNPSVYLAVDYDSSPIFKAAMGSMTLNVSDEQRLEAVEKSSGDKNQLPAGAKAMVDTINQALSTKLHVEIRDFAIGGINGARQAVYNAAQRENSKGLNCP